MSEKMKIDHPAKALSALGSLPNTLNNANVPANYKSLAFFLERTSESIHRTTVMIQQLESEVTRLKYEVMATENEYKNLTYIANDLELKASKTESLSQSSK
jgi:hypothetical protein